MYFPKMFHHLLDPSYQRRGLEIMGFYVAYLVVSVIFGAIIGTGISYFAGSSEFRVSWSIDSIAASILFLLLSKLIINKKRLGGGIVWWLIPLLAAALTLYATHFAGALIPTILSTRPNKNIRFKNSQIPRENSSTAKVPSD